MVLGRKIVDYIFKYFQIFFFSPASELPSLPPKPSDDPGPKEVSACIIRSHES